jgi:glucose-6-phosphate isomerase
MIKVLWDKSVDQNGVDNSFFENFESKEMDSFISKLEDQQNSGKVGFWTLPDYNKEELSKIKSVASDIRNNYDNFIVLGIGGSSLGAKAVINGLTNVFDKKNTKVYFPDNVDPEYFQDLLDNIDLSKTAFNVISKSGSTAETMAQFLVVYNKLCKELGKEEAIKRIYVTTDPEKGALRPLEKEYGFTTFSIPQNVGGRFSVLTAVGLLPSAVAGVNIDELLLGANDVAKSVNNKELVNNICLKYAILMHKLNNDHGKHNLVLMPYSTKLKFLSEWFIQLWAESLGKKLDVNENVVNVGQTPIPGVGATDQHSQVQLFMEGPLDKVVTFIGIEQYSRDIELPEFDKEIEAFSYLSGHTMGELLTAEMVATERALSENSRPSVRLMIEKLDAFHMGALLYFFEAATGMSGVLYNIDAFNQPGVELGKYYTYKKMGRRV